MNQFALDHSQTKNGHHRKFTTPYIESFENQIKADISTKKPIMRNNLTHNEMKALKDLQKREDIIIINADKGGAITILDTDNYIIRKPTDN